ncbi:MAG: hypothetical protein RL297_1673 [Pseudomonadota bacterium]|jgi:uncharacterized integral membrane protein (TIGR00697 family)
MNTVHSTSPAHASSAPNLSTLATIVLCSYIAAQMMADIASLKIGHVGGWAVDMGTFIYPLTFTLRDLIHKLMGKRVAQTIIFTAAGINAVMALYLMGAAWVQSDAGWAGSGPGGMNLGVAFAAILTPVWRIVLASIVAEVISELLDTEVYQWFVNRMGQQRLWARVLVSNAVSVPLDSALFCLIAFYGEMPNAVVWDIFVFNMVVKFALSVLTLPLIYAGHNTTANTAR